MASLVTGAAGFLGRYIVEQLLARGEKVRALVRRPAPELVALGAETFTGDIVDAARLTAACQGIETVYHVAARAGLGGSWRTYFEPNVQGTHNVLAACRANGVRKLIFTSSPSVTFAGVDQINIDESAPYPQKWLAHYPHSKAIAEREVLAAHDDATLLTCALRPHLIWGPRDAHLIPKLLARAQSGRLRRIGTGENLIDTIYAANAAEAHLQAADALIPGSRVGGQAYFLSQGEPVNCWGWINELLTLAGAPPVTRSLSLKTAWVIGAVCEGLWRVTGKLSDPPMTRFLAAQLATHHYFDISKARNDFGYSPRISLRDGMRQLAASCQWPLK
ncbi:MAG TPA: NAD-dependent epimerase/dehydratase family protein [Pirellulaceae bacterium]|nr:NAD-dependent epimerase/dehydratase family protein [Pirellulaceae bacterium]